MPFSLSSFSGLLIDFDGTLANTEPVHELALNKFFQGKGYQFGKKEHGKSTIHIFEDWGKQVKKEELAEIYLQEYLRLLPDFLRQHNTEAHWWQDAEEFLQRTENSPRVLTTGSFRAWLSAFDPQLNIFPKFNHFVTKEDLLPDHEKPDPLAYQLAAKKLGLKSEQCVAFEDSRVGILSAKSAGCFTVAVRRQPDAQLPPADMVISSFAEILV